MLRLQAETTTMPVGPAVLAYVAAVEEVAAVELKAGSVVRTSRMRPLVGSTTLAARIIPLPSRSSTQLWL